MEEISETERGEMPEGETVSGVRISTLCRHYVIMPRGWHASHGKRTKIKLSQVKTSKIRSPTVVSMASNPSNPRPRSGDVPHGHAT